MKSLVALIALFLPAGQKSFNITVRSSNSLARSFLSVVGEKLLQSDSSGDSRARYDQTVTQHNIKIPLALLLNLAL